MADASHQTPAHRPQPMAAVDVDIAGRRPDSAAPRCRVTGKRPRKPGICLCTTTPTKHYCILSSTATLLAMQTIGNRRRRFSIITSICARLYICALRFSASRSACSQGFPDITPSGCRHDKGLLHAMCQLRAQSQYHPTHSLYGYCLACSSSKIHCYAGRRAAPHSRSGQLP